MDTSGSSNSSIPRLVDSSVTDKAKERTRTLKSVGESPNERENDKKKTTDSKQLKSNVNKWSSRCKGTGQMKPITTRPTRPPTSTTTASKAPNNVEKETRQGNGKVTGTGTKRPTQRSGSLLY